MGSTHPAGGSRWLLTTSRRGVLAFALLGLAACRDSGSSSGEAVRGDDERGTSSDGELSWSRVDLGFVAAYVLVRGGEAAVVDTGVSGSADAIAQVLDDAGPGWAGVRHVLLTHKHPDHTGSLGDVLAAAHRATGYVGEADLAAVEAPRRLTAVRDGDEVFGLRVVATPGHTPGHVSLFDPTTRVLVAGDALANMRGLTGSPPQYTEDQATADASVGTLAALEPATILVGHGSPVSNGAAQALRRLAAQVAA